MKIKLINYQAHADSELDIVPGINVIVGRSDSGKSSVIRAIEAVANGGVMDKRHGAKQAEVHIDDCRRIRSGSKNHFELGSQVYKAMRSETPREIVNQLNLSDVNFRPQHSPYFLLSDSPGAVARSMNEFADLGLIDFVVGRAKTQAKSASDLVTKIKDEIEVASGKARALDWAVEADAQLQKIEGTEAQSKALEVELEAAEKTLAGIDEVESWLAAIPKLTSKGVEAIIAPLISADLDEVTALVKDIENINAQLAGLPELDVQPLAYVIDRLSSTIDPEPLQLVVEGLMEIESELKMVPDIGGTLHRVSEVRAALAEFEEPAAIEDLINLIASIPDNRQGVESINGLLSEVETVIASVDDEVFAEVNQLWRTLPGYNGDIDNLKAEIEWMNVDYRKLLTDAGVCPTCGGKV